MPFILYVRSTELTNKPVLDCRGRDVYMRGEGNKDKDGMVVSQRFDLLRNQASRDTRQPKKETLCIRSMLNKIISRQRAKGERRGNP